MNVFVCKAQRFTGAAVPLLMAIPTILLSGCALFQGSKLASTSSTGGTTSSELKAINHVVFMLQENHTFDNYFGMLNPYRSANGWTTSEDGKTYAVDGIDDKLSTANQNDQGQSFPLFKLKTACVDDESSGWLESFGDVNTYDFTTARPMQMAGFVHNAEGFANSCTASGLCAGQFTDLAGQRVMGYYDQDFLNYYYFMASQFALSDRWFSPVASKSTPNRLATLTGGTTQGLVLDPGSDDHLGKVDIPSIFQELDLSGVSWKVYYSVTQGECTDPDQCKGGLANYPATTLGYLSYYQKYFYPNPTGAACTAPTQASSVVGDASNSFCIDPNHIAPLSQYFSDVGKGTLPSFAFIEAGYGLTDEHPGSTQSVLDGQEAVAKIVNALMTSSSWKDSVFFFSYDEGGGPYDHVPPVPGHSNDFTSASLGSIPDISSIAVNPDNYGPCVPTGGVATVHCDLPTTYPGAQPNDAAAVNGFAAQLGFRVPNFVLSPFVRKHYVSHVPMDHTAIMKFVENRFIGASAHMTPRDAAQPDLMDFFDFSNPQWLTPPAPPNPVTKSTLGYDPCTPEQMGP